MRFILLSAILLLRAAVWAGSAQEDWSAVKALDAGPGGQPRTPAEAILLASNHVKKQEQVLRAFLAEHPTDENVFEATMRLARVLDRQSEMAAAPMSPEAAVLMSRAAELAKTPAQKTEYEFATITRRMRSWRDQRPPIDARRSLLEQARQFQAAHPTDRRIAALLVEIAALFDFDPATKESLLTEAKKMTKDPDLLAQIADDQRRLGFLGKQVPLRFTSLDRRRVDVREWQGKVVAVVFFATWSPPSTAGLIELKRAIDRAGGGVELVAVSLDSLEQPLKTFLTTNSITIPVAWDGKGWDGPLVQARGINSVPTAWLLDKQGVLRSLDALEQPDAQLRQLLAK